MTKLPVMLVITVAQGNGDSTKRPTSSASQKRMTLPMAPPSAIHRLLSSIGPPPFAGLAAGKRQETGAGCGGERGSCEKGRRGPRYVPQQAGDDAREQHRDAGG